MTRREILLDRVGGREAAALRVGGRLEDLLIDPAGDGPRQGDIFRARAGRPAKGAGGLFLDLPGDTRAFLRQARGISPGQPVIVQIAGTAEPGKAPPATLRIRLRSRLAVLTPGAPGVNIARSIGPADREWLAPLAAAAMTGAPEGLILRSAAAAADAGEIAAEIAALRSRAATLTVDGPAPQLLLAGPRAHARALQDWPQADIVDSEGAFARDGIAEDIDALLRPGVDLAGGGRLWIEPTRALVACDIDTGGDTSPAAGLKATLAAVAELPRQLRLRGLGGQVVLDTAPFPHRDRGRVEQALQRALREDPVETTLVGWTPLGHLELNRQRARIPLAETLPGGFATSHGTGKSEARQMR